MARLDAVQCRSMLVNLLDDYGVLNYFIRYIARNSSSYNGMNDTEIFNRFTMRISSIYSWVDRMGTWSDTEQGHGYWDVINTEFKHKLVEMENKVVSKRKRCRSIW